MPDKTSKESTALTYPAELQARADALKSQRRAAKALGQLSKTGLQLSATDMNTTGKTVSGRLTNRRTPTIEEITETMPDL